MEEGEISEDVIGTKRAMSEVSADEGGFEQPKRERRKGKKLKHKLESGTATKEEYFDIYGKDARASLEFQHDVMKSSNLKYRDVQELALWVLTTLVKKPNWVFVKNKPLVTGVVVIAIPELSESVFRENATVMPNLSSGALGEIVPISCPGSNTHVYPPMTNLLRIQKGRSSHHGSATSKAKPLATPLQAGELVMNADQMAKAEFPTIERNPTYISTATSLTENAKALIAIDCEMVVTEAGYELARATYVDGNGEVLYDEVIRPPRPVIDHVTRFSGITPEMLAATELTLGDAQLAFLNLVNAKTIVVGHSLENDFKAMQIIHERICDTSSLYADDRGSNYKPALKRLAERFLKLQIQQDSHDSITDAVTSLRLFELKQKFGQDFGMHNDADDGESMFIALQALQKKTSVIGQSFGLGRLDVPIGTSDLIETMSDIETLNASVSCCRKGSDFVFGLMSSVRVTQEDLDAPETAEGDDSPLQSRLRMVDQLLSEMYAEIPPNTLCLVVSGQPNTRAISEIWQRRKSDGLNEDDMQNLRHAVHTARQSVAFVSIKQ